jgi:uncharacterized protein (TIGR00251 family)
VSSADFVQPHDNGCIVDVFVQPRGAKDAIVGLHGAALKVKVTAPPVEGRANRAVEDLLARVLRVPRRDVSVVAGQASRRKRVHVSGMGPEIVSDAIEHVLSSRTHESGPEAFVEGHDGRREGRGEEARRQKDARQKGRGP